MKTAMALFVLAGCTSMHANGDAVYARGDYAWAAQLYDREVRAGDTSAIPLRTRAREQALRVELYNVQTSRAGGHEFIGQLGRLLDRRDAWNGDGAAAIAGAIAVEVSAASATIAAQIAATTDSDGPLAAEDAASHYEKLFGHADFAATREAIHVRFFEAGRARCARYEAAAATPYWRWLTARYCDHWAAQRPVPALPEQHTALVLDGAIAGETDAEATELRGALQRAFENSAWYAPTGTGEAHGTLAGTLAVTYASRDVTLTASWSENVSYTDYQTQQESYQEPYTDFETYTEYVSSMEWSPCGTSTCPHMVSHPVSKTRSVTKYRTAYRPVMKSVTQQRDEQRSRDYDAVERSGSYTSKLNLQVGDVAASVATSTSERGYDHDETIERASVSPQRAHLTSHEQFAAHEAATLADRLVEKLDESYVARFCGLSAFTLEQAAECAYAGAQHVPAAAQRKLAQVLGGDARFLSALIHHVHTP